MTYLRVALVCVLCGSCFKPQGKDTTGASESDATTEAATGTPTASTPTEASTTTGSPTSETVTTGSPTSETLTSGSPTSETVTSTVGETTGTASGVTTESVDTTTDVDSSGSTGGGAVCGNAVVEGDELCDDGNMVGGDKCPGNCKGPCTNGIIDGDEACDDGNTVFGDGCSPTCTRDGSYVFVTSDMFTGLMSGLGGADDQCNKAAQAAKLPGKYKAWLSDELTSAKERVVPTGMQYVRTDGTLVAKNLGDIVMKGLEAPINRTESKVEIKTPMKCSVDGMAWTSTIGNGDAAPGAPCENWQNNINPTVVVAGDIGMVNADWTAGCLQVCTMKARLYCFEVP